MPTTDQKPAAPSPKPAAAPEPAESQESEEAAPQVERVTMGALVLEKTVYPDGECVTKTLREPQIEKSLVDATRSAQRKLGH